MHQRPLPTELHGVNSILWRAGQAVSSFNCRQAWCLKLNLCQSHVFMANPSHTPATQLGTTHHRLASARYGWLWVVTNGVANRVLSWVHRTQLNLVNCCLIQLGTASLSAGPSSSFRLPATFELNSSHTFQVPGFSSGYCSPQGYYIRLGSSWCSQSLGW
jgi:hypothetical protein